MFNPNATYLLNGLVVSTHLSNFIKAKKKIQILVLTQLI